jgi:high affinity sulfate transporter 1
VIFSSLRGYRSSWLSGDLLAAITLLVIAIPEQLATSRLAGMPPITGLYVFIAGSVLFALLGANSRMSVGADSTISPLFAAGIAALAATGSARYVSLVGVLAVLVGVFVALVGLLRLGWIAEFLSEPITSGFLAGIAVIIVVHQLPDLFGLSGSSGDTLHRVAHVITNLHHTNGWSLGIGAGVLVLVLVAESIDRRLPAALVGMVGSTILVASLDLTRHGVPVLGRFAQGAPHLGLHSITWSEFSSIVPIAGVVALVVVSQTAATTRAFSDERVDVNRDFVGVGAGSIAAGLIGAFPANASPPRTAAVESAGGRTQAAGLLAAAGVAVLIPAASVLRDLPLATLAAVLMYVATRIVRIRELVAIARYDRIEFGLALITLFTVAIVGVQQGIAVAVGLAILSRTRVSARPQLHVLGRIPSTTSWAPLSGTDHAAQLPGVLVVLFATPLWYANAEHFRVEVKAAMARALGPLHVVVLDTIGMSDIDFTGSRALRRVLDDLDSEGIAFGLARTGTHVREGLRRSGLLQRIGSDHLYGSVDEAVVSLSVP